MDLVSIKFQVRHCRIYKIMARQRCSKGLSPQNNDRLASQRRESRANGSQCHRRLRSSDDSCHLISRVNTPRYLTTMPIWSSSGEAFRPVSPNLKYFVAKKKKAANESFFCSCKNLLHMLRQGRLLILEHGCMLPSQNQKVLVDIFTGITMPSTWLEKLLSRRSSASLREEVTLTGRWRVMTDSWRMHQFAAKSQKHILSYWAIQSCLTSCR
jgi:hypothetical protein